MIPFSCFFEDPSFLELAVLTMILQQNLPRTVSSLLFGA